MMKLGFTKDDGTPVVVLGLTDVNLHRMMMKADPVRVFGREFNAPKSAFLADAEIVVFHATRAACIDMADVLGIDQKVLLDRIGEG